MDDYISRAAAIKAIDDLQDCYNGFSDTYDKACIIGVLGELPAADVVSAGAYKQTAWERDTALEQLKELGYSLGEKIRQGHWIELDGNDANYFCCDRCGRRSDFKEPFCPNCGTKMLDVQPVRHGHWDLQNDPNAKAYGWHICSECGVHVGEPTNYCPNCGAHMEGSE